MPPPSCAPPVDRKPRIGILSLSAIPDDPRVRRQGDLLTQQEWDVVAVGLPGHISMPPEWACLNVGSSREVIVHDELARRSSSLDQAVREYRVGRGDLSSVFATGFRLMRRDPVATTWQLARFARAAIRQQARGLRRAGEIFRLGVDPDYVDTLYWRLKDEFNRIYRLALTQRVDLWLANDWTTLPIAMRLASEQRVPYGYDTHELAVDEYAHNRLWRLTQQPIIACIEAKGIVRAAFTTCVSDGIADRLSELYPLPVRPTVVRNTPMYSRHPFRPTGDIVRVLYHGLVAPGRGLESCIRSVALWRPEFRLTIRGPASAAYTAKLKAEARAAGVAERVFFDPPVPMTDLVVRAASFDVGLFALPDHSLQNVHVLPNKFFEYVMAGLALCVSDLPEMARLLRRYDLGQLISTVSPQSIADAINRLDRSNIDHFKSNALAAARDLNWDVEGLKLVAACSSSLMLGTGL